MNSDAGIVYIVDTNVLIDIRQVYPFPDLWEKIDELLTAKRIISHEYVYDEIVPEKGEMDAFTKMVSEHKDNFFETTQRQMILVSEIIPKYPKLIDAYSKKNQADPYLVAMAVELKENAGLFGKDEYVIVTNESKKKPMRIPAVCKEYGIRQLNLLEFIKENGWKLGIT